MIKTLESLKNTVNKYMPDIRPDRLTTCQSELNSTTKFIYLFIFCHFTEQVGPKFRKVASSKTFIFVHKSTFYTRILL
jgi:hypothetical protein